jgi:molybdate transport system substrate-binding protein
VVRANGEVDGIDIAGAEAAAGSYSIVHLKAAASPESAAAFVDFLHSDEAQTLLRELGFGPA